MGIGLILVLNLKQLRLRFGSGSRTDFIGSVPVTGSCFNEIKL